MRTASVASAGTLLVVALLAGRIAVASCVGGVPDGMQQPEEECDDGNADCGDACDPNCNLPGCGNGFACAVTGEACDDANTTDCDGCDGNCTLSVCGNGVTCPPEQCDDGGTANCDGCDGNCTLCVCGNGVTCPPEQCDDGGTANCDGCDGNCTPSACGNGVTCPPEQCDDGNMIDSDDCTNSCTIFECLPLPEWSAAQFRGTFKLPPRPAELLPRGFQPGGACVVGGGPFPPTSCPDFRRFSPPRTHTFAEPGFCYDPLDPELDVILASASLNARVEARNFAESACRDECEGESCSPLHGILRSCVTRGYQLGGPALDSYVCSQQVCVPNPFGGSPDPSLRYYQCVVNLAECKCRCVLN